MSTSKQNRKTTLGHPSGPRSIDKSIHLPPAPPGPGRGPEGTDAVDTATEETGPGTRRIADFPITEKDLTVLARHYLKEIRSLEFFLCLQYGWSDYCDLNNLYHRLGEIRSHLGAAAVDAIEAEMDQEFRAECGTAAWQAGGDEKAERFERESHRLSEKAQDRVARAEAIAHLSDHPTDLFFDQDGDVWFLKIHPPIVGPGPFPVLHLVLKSRTNTTVGTNFSMPEPDGWYPPYGLG